MLPSDYDEQDMYHNIPIGGESNPEPVVICSECDTKIYPTWHRGALVCPTCRATVRIYKP